MFCLAAHVSEIVPRSPSVPENQLATARHHAEFLSSLTWSKVRELPEALQSEARRAWLRRWQRLLACAAAKAFAMSLLGLVPGGSDGAVPSVHEAICEARYA